ALDMMCERALSRHTQGEVLAKKQMVQQYVADSRIELEQFRLLVMRTAEIIDTEPHGAAREHIAMCKVAMPKVLHDIVQRSIQVHGSLGTTDELPLTAWFLEAAVLALADGPTEVHKITVAKQVLRRHSPAPGLFPTEHIPPRLDAVGAKYADILKEHDA